MYEQIRQVVHDSGLWDNGRESSHGFVLSPSVYEVPREKRNELEAIGAALHDCLAGLGRIAAVAYNPKLGHGATWGMITKTLHTGVPTIYHDIMSLNPSSAPSICKVDIMESADGNYHIAEIDGHNKHGLGYSTLAARIRKVVAPGAQSFPGVAAALAQETKKRGGNELVMIRSEQERFYAPEFRILRDELAAHGVHLILAAESEVITEGERVYEIRVEGRQISIWPNGDRVRVFVDLPFLYHNHALNNRLAELYRSGEIDFLIPPKPFLGSKAILALLRNDEKNEELEAILKSQIRPTSLALLRRYIPETYLVHRRAKVEYWWGQCHNRKFVLKECISSGMKGTVFSDEPHFNATMKRACDSYYRFILQEEVTNRSRSFQYFADGGCLRQGEWFMRVTVHYAVRRVADIVITARQDKKVHGALDCLQFGAIVV